MHREYSIYTLSWECTVHHGKVNKEIFTKGGGQNKTINFKKSLKCRALAVHNSYFLLMSVLTACMFVHHAVLHALLEEALDP